MVMERTVQLLQVPGSPCEQYVDMNRKMLAEMAVNDAAGFTTLAELAKANQK